MDQLFKEYVLMCLIIGFNLEQLFGLAFFSSHGFLCDVLFRDLFAFVIVYFKLRHILNRPAQGSNLLTDALEGEGLPPTWEGKRWVLLVSGESCVSFLGLKA
uniref:Uncharacterized protein n=1 Tax=Treubia lacunosa TaxID=93845 RepID=G4Y9T7_9MARC|nr:hypothetical protein TrlaMp38 [Treubia lacunosa]AEH99733.1 hypothetical protein TrlaMp38 [Treubia lacunosa]